MGKQPAGAGIHQGVGRDLKRKTLGKAGLVLFGKAVEIEQEFINISSKKDMQSKDSWLQNADLPRYN